MQSNFFQQLRQGKREQQIIFFPYLAGHADNFLSLADSMHEDIEVWSSNLPGHGKCSQRALLKDIHGVVSLYAKEIKKIAKPSSIYFGHSMGGIIAYFLLQRLLSTHEDTPKPAALILSACPIPGEFSHLNTARLSDKDLLSRLETYDGMTHEILKEQVLLDYFMPIFRADFSILESASSCECWPLDIPVYYLWGENDKIASIDSAMKWLKYFSTEINLVPIANGSHMFLDEKPFVVAEIIEHALAKHCEQAPLKNLKTQI